MFLPSDSQAITEIANILHLVTNHPQLKRYIYCKSKLFPYRGGSLEEWYSKLKGEKITIYELDQLSLYFKFYKQLNPNSVLIATIGDYEAKKQGYNQSRQYHNILIGEKTFYYEMSEEPVTVKDQYKPDNSLPYSIKTNGFTIDVILICGID